MIQMWDDSFAVQSPPIRAALDAGNGIRAFELMHSELDKVWREVERVLGDGCIACVNIGDATRTICGRFRLYSNHSRIIQAFVRLGFDVLPAVVWKKTTNAPNKFMGSGMLPAGAYVTLEHEYILVFRKGGKRSFRSEDEKRLRNSSAFFWEERNHWFSDMWDLKGVRQKLINPGLRDRSAAFPFEIPYRLINMYSVYGDTVLDPFVGTGTTIAAAAAAGRSSIGVEIDSALLRVIADIVGQAVQVGNERITSRLRDHLSFVADYQKSKGDLKHVNDYYGFPVMTKQEREIVFHALDTIERSPDPSSFCTRYSGLDIGMGEGSCEPSRLHSGDATGIQRRPAKGGNVIGSSRPEGKGVYPAGLEKLNASGWTEG